MGTFVHLKFMLKGETMKNDYGALIDSFPNQSENLCAHGRYTGRYHAFSVRHSPSSPSKSQLVKHFRWSHLRLMSSVLAKYLNKLFHFNKREIIKQLRHRGFVQQSGVAEMYGGRWRVFLTILLLSITFGTTT